MDVLSDSRAVIISEVAPGIRVGILTHVTANDVVIAWEFTLPTPSENLIVFGLAAFSLATAILDCTRVLQAWMPAYHV